MTKDIRNLDRLVDSLDERVKELNCIYEVEETLQSNNLSLDQILQRITEIIKVSMQFPESCEVKIKNRDVTYKSGSFKETKWFIKSEIKIQNFPVGWIKVFYKEEKPLADDGPFLSEEVQLIQSISKRLSDYLMYQRLKMFFNKWETTKQGISEKKQVEWQVVLELLRRTDPEGYIRIARKMLHLLVWRGIKDAESLLQQFVPLLRYGSTENIMHDSNIPLQKRDSDNIFTLSNNVFEIAQSNLSNIDILSNIQKWIQQDKSSFLIKTCSNIDSSIPDIIEAMRRYYKINPVGMQLAPSARIGVRASLIRRFFTEQLEFISIAKNFLKLHDFYELSKRLIVPPASHGKLGGKSAGLFLAYHILKNNQEFEELFDNIKMPKTWYLTSDIMIHFINHNNLEELMEQKYKPIDEVRKEYPHVIQLFKSSHFPLEIKQGLSMALDDFGTNPLIVRSSSLLEDRLGSAFSGKYKSLFLANQGDKNERMEALMDAIAEVYASTLGPDPIHYRSERGLIDFHEEMGILIQEVVGTRVGDYFFPAFAGVAFSNNEFRWSPRIKREDGLIRLVPGLGTRAVDRLSDDYPVLIAPGQPGLRANISIDDIIRYSPQKVDCVDLKINKFETLDIKHLLRCCGDDIPLIDKITSLVDHNYLKQPNAFSTDFRNDDLIITFEGLIQKTKYIKQLHTILKTLQNALATPVDIEFASDGNDFYLLQCRPQSYSKLDAPSAIPTDIPPERLLFSANRFVSNGIVPDISYIVYIDPQKYSEIGELDELRAIGSAVGKLNELLPRRRFILMGPGRWGSRGDIKLGVNVTYSDISNTAVLIEIARKKGNYVPDLSFGTHFFQDLVEAQIRYLPLYPDDDNIVFNEDFFTTSPNMIYDFLPAYDYLANVLRIIEVPAVANGMVLRLLMNADVDKAVGILTPKTSETLSQDDINEHLVSAANEEHWRWRLHMAERIASQIDPKIFGVKKIYVHGSTKYTTAQAGSDIDLLVHFVGNKQQKRDLMNWFNGWSLCLDEINFLRTGFKAGGILDVQFVSDKEMKDQSVLVNKYKIDLESMQQLQLHSAKNTINDKKNNTN